MTAAPQTAIQKLQAGPRASPAAPPGMFPAGLSAQANFQDVDQLTATIRKWDHRVVQLGRGQFHGSLSLAHIASLQIYRAAWGPAFLVQGRVPASSVVFGAQCGGAPGANWRGRELSEGEILLLEGHQELDLQTRGDCDVLVLSIDANLFAQHAEALHGRPVRLADSRTWRMLGQSDVQRQLVRNWMKLLHDAMLLGQQLCDHKIAAQVEAATLEMILRRAAPGTREAPMAERRRAAIQARRYMVLNMDEPLTIQDICQAVHATERTLHLGFREAFGMSPKKFLKSLRLNAIRRDLQHAPPDQTVTSLACRRGFFHFSNLAADYYQQFGETPSQTRHQSLAR